MAKLEGKPQVYLLTVRHLLGPSGGFPQLIVPDQVASFVTAIRLQYLFVPASKPYRVEGLKVPESADVKAPLFDVTIFKAKDAWASDAATITADKPAMGETLWVISHVAGGVGKGQYVHPAKVTENGERWLVCEFENPQIVTSGASGAPVLNAAGKIVGIYSGHGGEPGKVKAYVIPSSLIAKVIKGESVSP